MWNRVLTRSKCLSNIAEIYKKCMQSSLVWKQKESNKTPVHTCNHEEFSWPISRHSRAKDINQVIGTSDLAASMAVQCRLCVRPILYSIQKLQDCLADVTNVGISILNVPWEHLCHGSDIGTHSWVYTERSDPKKLRGLWRKCSKCRRFKRAHSCIAIV